MSHRLNHVVLIDDNETTNFLNRRLLDKLQVTQQISVFTSAAQAFQTVWGENSATVAPPELVFVDLHMPQMDGVEFLALFQNLPAAVRARTRMAVLTTSLLPADRDRVAVFTGIEYLVKPLSREKLEKLIGRFFPHVRVAPVV